MKINTDLVKGKKHSSAVKPNTLKHSQEYRVLATLRYLYPSKFDAMITGEAPNLQDSARAIQWRKRLILLHQRDQRERALPAR